MESFGFDPAVVTCYQRRLCYRRAHLCALVFAETKHISSNTLPIPPALITFRFFSSPIFSLLHISSPQCRPVQFDNMGPSIDPPTPDPPITTAMDLPTTGRISNTLAEQLIEFIEKTEKLQTLPAQVEKLQTQVEKLQTQMEKMGKSVTKLDKGMRNTKDELNVTILDAIHGQKKYPSKTDVDEIESKLDSRLQEAENGIHESTKTIVNGT